MDFQKALDLINKSNNILITTHVRPDGDACGCIVAIDRALNTIGKKTNILLLSDAPEWYNFLFDQPPAVLDKDLTAEQLMQEQFAQPDLIIIVDTNSYSQLPQFDSFLKQNHRPVLVIDHHITADGLGDVELIDTTAAATGVIVLDLFKFAKWPVNKQIAQALFVAVATDTGWFHFRNPDSRTFNACAELVRAGADPADIFHDLYQSFSIPRFKLMVAMLNTLELHFDGRYAEQHLTLAHFKQTGATHKDTENLIDECRRIGDVQVATLFVESPDGKIKCSLRSTGPLDVRLIAQQFGGGGHKMAAGTHLPGPLQNAKKMIFDAVAQKLSAT
jgi:phosphoesterase RecJ-like protein